MTIAPDTTPPTRPQVVQGAFWAASGAIGRYALAGVTTLILTRLLEPGDFGLIAITYAAQALIAHIVPSGFHDALIQRPQLSDGDLNAAFWSILLLVSGALLLIMGCALPVASWFDQPMLASLWIGMAFASTLRALDAVPRALLNRRLDFRALTIARLIGMLAGSLCAVSLAALGGGAWSLIVQFAILYFVDTLILWRAVHWRPGGTFSRANLRPLWQFAPSVSLLTILTYVTNKADDQLVGYRLGPEALGFYALAYGFMAWPVRDVLGSVSGVLYPVFSRIQNDPPRFQAAYLESLQIVTAFAFPTLALIAITAPVLIPWLLGPRWSPSVLAAQILALGGLRASTMMLNGAIFRARGQPHIHTLFQLCSLGPYLTAFVVGLGFGIEGVALFSVIVGIILHPVSLWLVLNTAQITPRQWIAALLPTAAAAMLMAMAAVVTLHVARHIWNFSPFPALALTGIISAAVYGGALAVWTPPGLRRTWAAAYQVLTEKLLCQTFSKKSPR
jgi:O-antigen/teichoic acid export membrane protein